MPQINRKHRQISRLPLLTLQKLTTLLAFAAFSLLPSQTLACSCIWQGAFAEAQANADLVVNGEVVSHQGNSFDFAVSKVMRGESYRETLRVWTNDGKTCRPDIKYFPVNQRFVLAIDYIKEVPPGGFNPFTPNKSFGRAGDYQIKNCGVFWIKEENGYLVGNLADGPRWEFENDKKNPVMLSLLESYLAGNTSIEALAEAEKPQDEIKELMFETRYHMKSSDNSGLAKVISKALAGASEEKELTEEQVMELLENTEPVPEDPNEDTANGENFIPEDILDPDNALEFAPIDFIDSGDEEY